ncbi:flagellar hook-length control protein FliK [Tepidicaulis sp. LMO-SS28]|uniref:flagellar hook-length control protein FliK n=1 Tax=Tepidicaulis sp. LMO-SS28 TaxID=3447455 RepID=UPI003EE3D4FA
MSSDRSFSFPLDMSYEYDVRSTARAQKPAREDTYREDEAESFSSYLEQNRQEDPPRSKPADTAQNTAGAASERQAAPATAESKTAKKKSGQAQETPPAQTQNAESQPAAQTKETANKKEAASAQAAAAANAAKGDTQTLPADKMGKKAAKTAETAQQAKNQQAAPQAAEMPANQAAKTGAGTPAAETAQNIAAAAKAGTAKETGTAKPAAAPETVPPQRVAARAPMANDPRLQNQAANGIEASAQKGTGEEAKAAKTAAQPQGALPQQNTAAPQSPQLGFSQAAPLFGAPGSEGALTSPAGAEGTVGNASTAAVSDGQARFAQLSNMQTGNVVTAPRMTAQVGDALIQAARNGTEKLTLQLFPEELGTVDITLEMQNGRLKIVVAAERPETQQQLQQNQRDLERSLAEAGIDHGNADLSFAEWESREQREPGTPFERLTFGVAAAEPAENAPGQTVSLTPGGIDLRL